MAWNDEKQADDLISSSEWNNHVDDQESRIDSIQVDDDGATVVSFDDGESVSLDFTGSFSVSESENVVDIGIASGGISNTELENTNVTIAGNTVSLGGSTSIDVVDLSTTGEADTVPVSQGDGTLQMQEMEGGVEIEDQLQEFEEFKRELETIRNQDEFIEWLFENDEDRADHITNNEVLNHYIFEADEDAYDLFINPNHSTGLLPLHEEGLNEAFTSFKDRVMFLAPRTFLDGLLLDEDRADSITSNEDLMDAIMEGDHLLDANLRFTEGVPE